MHVSKSNMGNALDALQKLVQRGETDLPGIPSLVQLMEIPEFIGLIQGSSTARGPDGMPVALKKALSWAAIVVGRHGFDGQTNHLMVEPLYLRARATAVTDAWKMLCGLLYSGMIRIAPPLWMNSLVKRDGARELIEKALSSTPPHSPWLYEVWGVRHDKDILPWFKVACDTAAAGPGRERFLPSDKRGL